MSLQEQITRILIIFVVASALPAAFVCTIVIFASLILSVAPSGNSLESFLAVVVPPFASVGLLSFVILSINNYQTRKFNHSVFFSALSITLNCSISFLYLTDIGREILHSIL